MVSRHSKPPQRPSSAPDSAARGTITRLLLALALLLATLAACGAMPGATAPTLTPSPSAQPAGQTVEPPTPEPTTPPIDAPTTPPTIAATTPCGYMWAYQEAPGVPERARAALEAAGLAPSAVSAQVFGENCVNQDGSVARFLAMGTTVTAELPVADLADQQALGELVVTATSALESIGETPGPEPEARLIFAAGGETRALKYSLRLARQHIDAGRTGADLLALLGYQP